MALPLLGLWLRFSDQREPDGPNWGHFPFFPLPAYPAHCNQSVT